MNTPGPSSTPYRSAHSFHRLPLHSLLALLFLLGFSATVAGQSVSWGTNGAGGSGDWDLTTFKWYNGSFNVAWPEGGHAVFGGASGTVNSFTFGPTVSAMTFNTPGYLIQNGWIKTAASGVTVTTNADATISSLLQGENLVKQGAARLTLDGSQFLQTITVNQGELRALGSSSLFNADIVLANSPGVSVTLAPTGGDTLSLGSLGGGGTSGGIVQPNNQARTVTATIFGGGTFGGVLQDNGAGVLALSLSDQVLTNANTYSGPTGVGGDVILQGNGSALNSDFTVGTFGSLVFDNAGAVLANRVSDTRPIALARGAISLIGNNTTPVEELLGPLTLSAVSAISVTEPGSATAQLTFASVQRSGHATTTVLTPGVKFTGLANDATGIAPVYMTTGNEFVTVDGNGRIAPNANSTADINTGAATDHVKISSGGATALAAAATKASLNLQNSSGGVQTLNLAGQALTLTSGGLLSSGTSSSAIESGTLSTTAEELVVTARNNLSISSTIADNGTATTLTKTGAGTLTLSGSNTYSGDTAIMDGTVIVQSDANLGLGSKLELSGGTLQAGASFSSNKQITFTSGLLGKVDTAGFDVSFAGSSYVGFDKRGAGSLELTGPTSGSLYLNEGMLAVDQFSNAFVTQRGGTLQAAGQMARLDASNLNSNSSPVLDVGGLDAAALAISIYMPNGNSPNSIIFGLGSGQSDMLNIGFLRIISGVPTFQFHFDNLGGVAPGVTYPLMSFAASLSPFSMPNFQFAPEMAGEGWIGTFVTTDRSVGVRFTAVPVPEPSTTALMLLQGVGLAWLGRRWLGKRRTA